MLVSSCSETIFLFLCEPLLPVGRLPIQQTSVPSPSRSDDRQRRSRRRNTVRVRGLTRAERSSLHYYRRGRPAVGEKATGMSSSASTSSGPRARPSASSVAVTSECSDTMRLHHRFILSVLLLLPAVRAAVGAKNGAVQPKNGMLASAPGAYFVTFFEGCSKLDFFSK